MHIKRILTVFVCLLISLMTNAQSDNLPLPEPNTGQEPIFSIQVENLQTITGRGNKTTKNILISNIDGLCIIPDPINSTIKSNYLRPSPVDAGTLRFDGTSNTVASGWEFYNSYLKKSIIYVRQNPGNIGIGTINPKARLAVNGEMVAAKVRLTLASWSDFVFDPSYKLLSLGELQTFIAENKHLPGIPSAKEVAENDLDIGQTEADLLQKIEELTLYLIDQEKELSEQEQLLQKQRILIEKRAARITALEKKLATDL